VTKRVLLIAEAANPEWVSVPLVGWSLADAIARQMPAHLVTHVRNRNAIQKTGLIEGRDFTVIDSEAVARPLWRIGNLLRGKSGVSWTTSTAIAAFSYYYFEWLVWKRFGKAIQAGEFDVVHRITPLSPTVPSILARKCRRAGVPFVVGPLNGGVPWPKGFDAARRREREWLSYVRSAYKLMPGYSSMLDSAAALIIGSQDTLQQVPTKFRHKCVYLPENAINPERFSLTAMPFAAGTLRACFVGRLVPYKGPDMLLEAVAPLLREGRLHLDIIGDGPLMPTLRDYVQKERLEDTVTLHGWIDHRNLQKVMCESQLLTFPSIREFGGGVVLEAMALGLVPIVVGYAGPGELVIDEVGFKVPIGQRQEIIVNLRKIVESICDKPEQIAELSESAKKYVQAFFTWDAKASQVMQVYDWVSGRQEKPVFSFKITQKK
jgi:glycosyltransferase involved in cell wall biosynthesis